jgi:hypothetical protein
MDDYNTSMLSEAKNEYCIRLLNIITPLVIEGVKSILKEADTLCITNNEEEKYLMTFQNFLSRVPKWNNDIISEETNRIIAKSGCNYLEDLLTCVHITQLKVLTSIRVGSKQKKIELDIPKLTDFIHKVYIKFARKIYTNVYLFEKNVQALLYQKNMRECETICKECILDVIRDSIPVEKILRSYIDESNEEEIVEEIKETLEVAPSEVDASENSHKEEQVDSEDIATKNLVVKKSTEEETPVKVTPPVNEVAKNETVIKVETLSSNEENEPEGTIKDLPDTPKISKESSVPEVSNVLKNIIDENKEENKQTLSFSDTDIAYDKKMKPEKINAPKTIERLEKISAEAHKKRKEEEEEEDDEDKITIGGTVKLDVLDIHDLEKDIKLKPDISNEIQILT